MPNPLEIRIKNLKKHTLLISLTGWFLVILIGLEIEAFLLNASAQIKLIIFALIAVCSIILIYLGSVKPPPITTHQIPILCTKKDSLITSLNAGQILDDAYIVFQNINTFKLRMLIQFIPQFDKDILAIQRKKANRKINMQCHVKSNQPFHDALKMLRINLVVCEDLSDPVLRWVEHDTANLLSRNESIIQAAVILKQGVLLFPDCPHGLTYIEIKKYELAAKLLCSLLGAC